MKRKTVRKLDMASFAACVRLLRKGLESLADGSFGRQPTYAPEIFHYSKAVAIGMGNFPREEVLKVRDEILAGGRIFNLRKPEQLADLRCKVAERLLEKR